jgi:UDP-2,3-diacylglucosamine pyrophosphatase LpxH
MKIQALFISDVHLGTKGSNATQVLEVLKEYQPEYLFLVGDIIDGWMLKRKFRWSQSHTNVLRKILS